MLKDYNQTIIIDLKGKTKEGILKQIDRSRRKNINKAEREGLIFKEADENEWLEYYKIYSRVWREGGVNPEPIENLNKPNCKLFVVKYKDKVVGGGLIEIQERGINFVAFASLIEYQDKRVNDFLYWNSILFALSNNMDYVDLGGYQEKARGHMIGINTFKEQWGGEIAKREVKGNIFYILGRKAIRNSPAVRWMWDRIKNRPVSVKDKRGSFKIPIIILLLFFITKLYHLTYLVNFLPSRDFPWGFVRIFYGSIYGFNGYVPNLINGFKISLLYPPLHTIIGSKIYSIFGNIGLAMVLSIILIYIIGFIGVWYLGHVRRWDYGKRLFLFLIFFANPISIFLFNLSGRIPEMLGWAFLLTILPIIYYYKNNTIDKKFMLYFSPLSALLILSHQIIIAFLGIFLLGLFIIKNNKERLYIIASGMLSLALTSWWWIPMLMNWKNSSMSIWIGMNQLSSKIEILFAIFTSVLFFGMFYFYYKDKKDNKELLFYLPAGVVALTYLTTLIKYIPMLNKPFPRTYALFFFLLSLVLLLEINFNEKNSRKMNRIVIFLVIFFVIFSLIRYPTMDFCLYNEENRNIFKTFESIDGNFIVVSKRSMFPAEGVYEYGAIFYNLTTPDGQYLQGKQPSQIKIEGKIKKDVIDENCKELREDLNLLKVTEVISEGDTCNFLAKCWFKKKATNGNICLFQT